MVKNCQTPLLDHLGPFLSDLDQKWKKWLFHQKWPTHRAKVISWLISAIPEHPRQPGPIFLAQNGLYICPRHRSICFMLNSLRPPKRPSKARNGQKDRFFWSRPKIVGQPDIFNCFTCFMAENINVPSSYPQNWHRKGQNIKKCHETTKMTFNSYCETPCRCCSWWNQFR